VTATATPAHPFNVQGIRVRGGTAWENRYRAVAPGAWLWIGLSISGAALVGLCLAWKNVPSAGFHALNDLGRLLPDWALANLTELGNTAVLAALFVLFGRRHPQLLLAFVLATLAGAVFIANLKDLFAMARPPAVFDTSQFRLVGEAYQRGSFPSGHTFATFASAAVALAFVRSWPRRLLILLAATLIGASRVMVGVHWPIDVCAGAFGGLATGGLAVLASRHLRPGYHPAAHVSMVWLVVVSNVLLVDSGSNYAQAAALARAIAIASTVIVAYQYLWLGRRPEPAQSSPID
jgi:membrane-associated phospholipid phosphatase